MVKKIVSFAVLKKLVEEMVEAKTLAVNTGNFTYKGNRYSIGASLKKEGE